MSSRTWCPVLRRPAGLGGSRPVEVEALVLGVIVLATGAGAVVFGRVFIDSDLALGPRPFDEAAVSEDMVLVLYKCACM